MPERLFPLIQLTIIGYTVCGWQDVLTILIMIAAIHVLEACVLNPKFMSSRTQLPVFFTFVVLLVAERLFGTWGLISRHSDFTFS